jgi:hypothetical protein
MSFAEQYVWPEVSRETMKLPRLNRFMQGS